MKDTPVQSALIRNAQTGNYDNAMFYMNGHSVRKSETLKTRILSQFLRRGVPFDAACFVGSTHNRRLSAVDFCPANYCGSEIFGDGQLYDEPAD